MTLRIQVDLELCENHGQCVFAAPEVFAMSEDGALVVVVDDPDDALRLQLEDAADVCPVQAIRLED